MMRTVLIITLFATTLFAENIQKRSLFLSNYKEIIDETDKNSLEVQKERVDFLESSSPNSPFIDDIEVRYKADDFTFEKHDFKLRVSPKAWGATSAGKVLYTTSLKYEKDKISIFENKLLSNRYKIITKLIHLEKEYALEKQLLLIYQDKVNIKKLSVGDINFDFDELMILEDNVTKSKLNIIDTENRIAELKNECGFEGDFTFDTTGYITSKFIDNFLATEIFAIDSSNIYIKISESKFNLAQGKYDLETAENRKIVSYFDLEYQHDLYPGRKDILQEHFSAGIGIKIPLVSAKNLTINNRKIDLLKEKENLYEKRQQLAEAIQILKQEVTIFNTQLTLLLDRKKEVSRDSYFEKMMSIEGISPMILLNAKESILKTDQKIESINYEMVKNYIELLNISGKMFQKPLKNYLSTSLEPIAE